MDLPAIIAAEVGTDECVGFIVGEADTVGLLVVVGDTDGLAEVVGEFEAVGEVEGIFSSATPAPFDDLLSAFPDFAIGWCTSFSPA